MKKQFQYICLFGLFVGSIACAMDNSSIADQLVRAIDCKTAQDVKRIILENKGVDLNVPNRKRILPLDHAACGFKNEIVLCLLAHGANPNFKLNGLPLLSRLIMQGNEAIPTITLLVANGASALASSTFSGYTVLHDAAKCDVNAETMNLLMRCVPIERRNEIAEQLYREARPRVRSYLERCFPAELLRPRLLRGEVVSL